MRMNLPTRWKKDSFFTHLRWPYLSVVQVILFVTCQQTSIGRKEGEEMGHTSELKELIGHSTS